MKIFMMNGLEPYRNQASGNAGELEPNAALEADLLRRTLIDLLVENEQLRTALQVNQPPAPQQEQMAERAPHQSPALAGVSEPHFAHHVALRGRYSVEARRAAVARFQGKKKRRLMAIHQGPRYVKMKAVADGKQRNSSGKFVKKGDQIVVVTPAETEGNSADPAADPAAPQILEVQIEPRFEPSQEEPAQE